MAGMAWHHRSQAAAGRGRGDHRLWRLLSVLGVLTMTGSLAVPLMVLLGAASGYSNEAHLILRKEISSDECKVSGADLQCVVEGGDTTLSYSLYNVGTSAAYDVQIADDTLDEAFTLTKPVGFTFESIAA
jgi:hypothetical protein